MSKFGICMDLKSEAITQYSNFNFESIGNLYDTPVGANSSGLFTLEGSTDNGTLITPLIEFAETNLGTTKMKRLGKLDFHGEFGSSFNVTIMPDSDTTGVTHTAAVGRVFEHYTASVVSDYNNLGVTFKVRVECPLGADFSIDMIEAYVSILTFSKSVNIVSGRAILEGPEASLG